MSFKRRSLLERAKAIFRFIDARMDLANQSPIPKSEFQQIGFSPSDMDQWIDLIQIIQSSPRLHLMKKGNRKYISQRDNGFSLYMKRIFLDPSRKYDERKNALLLYFNAIIALEKLNEEVIDIERIIEESWELDRPTIIKMREEALADLN